MKLFFGSGSTFRRLCFLLPVSFVAILLACKGRDSETAAAEIKSAVISDSGKDSTYYGKNSLKYTIEGRHVDIKDALKTGEGKYTTVLYVNKAFNHAGTVRVSVTNLITDEVFDLIFPANGTSGTGTYLGTHGLNNFYSDAVNIRVISLTATNITASFSGKFKGKDPKQGTVDILDGSFDLVTKNE